jgi:hypothetical protein
MKPDIIDRLLSANSADLCLVNLLHEAASEIRRLQAEIDLLQACAQQERITNNQSLADEYDRRMSAEKRIAEIEGGSRL